MMLWKCCTQYVSQQIWKTQQWPQDWKRSVFIPIPKKGNAKECSNYRTIALISHTSNCCCCCKVASVVSNSVLPQRQKPTRLLRPWDSPGKNTGVGCHFLLQCMKVKSESEVAQSCPTPSDPMDCSPPSSSVHGILQARILEWVAISFSISSNSEILNNYT